MNSIKDIKEYIKNKKTEEQLNYLLSLNDSRKGIVNLIAKIERNIKKDQEEKERLYVLSEYERKLKKENYKYIVGIDEVGRGPLAGPVVASCVILPEYEVYKYINDSKKVSKKRREELFELINETAIVSYGSASPKEIDEYNILNATKLAMKRAIEKLPVKPDFLLIDAVKLDDININQLNIIKGDEKSISIAAASIMAKVTRDRLMEEYDEKYPGYDFKNNKGYGTRNHYYGLDELGVTEIHRRTFL